MPFPQLAQKGFQAAVVRQKGGPFRIEAVDITPPRHDEVLVRVVATGMCHTDMVARDQVYPVPQPIVLGHEGAGVIEALGENVTKVQKGDHVVLSFNSCGTAGPAMRAIRPIARISTTTISRALGRATAPTCSTITTMPR
jgi:aryl-alcohol dehydrogenase